MSINPLPGHPAGENLRRAAVSHMCPSCGFVPNVFCPDCQGRGELTDLELSIWQKRQDRIMQGGEP